MTDLEFFRHTLATIAYRAAKTIRTAPPSFADFKPGPTTKTPREIVAHMGDLFDWSYTVIKGEPQWKPSTPQGWETEVARFFASMKKFDEYLASGSPIKEDITKLFQGPVGDALTHTGQLAMLRRLHGSPMKGESYRQAEVVIGRVGIEQTPPRPECEFD